MITIGSLFSGCGGLELGIERAIPSSKTIWQVEKEPYARKILARHWPDAERFEDVKTVKTAELAPVTIVSGGFPCTDVSIASARAKGLSGEESGLWWHMYRIIRDMAPQPRAVVIENVPTLTHRGLPTILGALWEAGFDAEWDCISASSQGAPHRRDRLFIVAYPHGTGLQEQRGSEPDAAQHPAPERCSWWSTGSEVCRVADGLSGRVDRVSRLKLLGNAVVPQVAYQVGLRVKQVLAHNPPNP